MNAVPIPAAAAAADGEYPVVIFDRAELNGVVLSSLQAISEEIRKAEGFFSSS